MASLGDQRDAAGAIMSSLQQPRIQTDSHYVKVGAVTRVGLSVAPYCRGLLAASVPQRCPPSGYAHRLVPRSVIKPRNRSAPRIAAGCAAPEYARRRVRR